MVVNSQVDTSASDATHLRKAKSSVNASFNQFTQKDVERKENALKQGIEKMFSSDNFNSLDKQPGLINRSSNRQSFNQRKSANIFNKERPSSSLHNSKNMNNSRDDSIL